jgi:hypothetical protein
METYPWSLDEFGVEHLLPSVETLHVSSVIEEGGDSFPVASAVLVNQLLEFLILLLGPPAFLERGAVMGGLLVVNLRYFLQHLID